VKQRLPRHSATEEKVDIVAGLVNRCIEEDGIPAIDSVNHLTHLRLDIDTVRSVPDQLQRGDSFDV